jgi:hypothetical protein
MLIGSGRNDKCTRSGRRFDTVISAQTPTSTIACRLPGPSVNPLSDSTPSARSTCPVYWQTPHYRMSKWNRLNPYTMCYAGLASLGHVNASPCTTFHFVPFLARAILSYWYTSIKSSQCTSTAVYQQPGRHSVRRFDTRGPLQPSFFAKG